jgi:hypothetical protein
MDPLVILLKQPGPQFLLEGWQCQLCFHALVARRGIARKVLEKELIYASEEAFDFATPTGNPLLRKDQLDAQIRRYLLQMLARKV